jgi:hypothetical protein
VPKFQKLELGAHTHKDHNPAHDDPAFGAMENFQEQELRQRKLGGAAEVLVATGKQQETTGTKMRAKPGTGSGSSQQRPRCFATMHPTSVVSFRSTNSSAN